MEARGALGPRLAIPGAGQVHRRCYQWWEGYLQDMLDNADIRCFLLWGNPPLLTVLLATTGRTTTRPKRAGAIMALDEKHHNGTNNTQSQPYNRTILAFFAGIRTGPHVMHQNGR